MFNKLTREVKIK